MKLIQVEKCKITFIFLVKRIKNVTKINSNKEQKLSYLKCKFKSYENVKFTKKQDLSTGSIGRKLR